MKCAKCGEELNGMPMKCPHCGCMLEWNVGCTVPSDYASDYASDYDGGVSDYQTTIAENPSATIDYDSLARGKLCPLKATRPPVLGFWNLDPAPDLAATLKAGVIKCRADGEPPRVEYIGGQ